VRQVLSPCIEAVIQRIPQEVVDAGSVNVCIARHVVEEHRATVVRAEDTAEVWVQHLLIQLQ